MSLSIDSISEEDLYFKPIQEDSPLWRGVSYIPIIGEVVSIIQRISIAGQIQETLNPTRVSQLLKVANKYKEADAFRYKLYIIISIAGLSINFLAGRLLQVILGAITIIPWYLTVKLNREEIKGNRVLMQFLGTSSFENVHPKLSFQVPSE